LRILLLDSEISEYREMLITVVLSAVSESTGAPGRADQNCTGHIRTDTERTIRPA
jgi:hypothetical protein